MTSWKELFQLPEEIHYFNHAYMAPLPEPVERAGIDGVRFKREPWKVVPEDFFQTAQTVRQKFAGLVNCAGHEVAIIPSASYGLSAACQNVDPALGNHAITVAQEFPSGYYAVQRWCRKNAKTLKVITPLSLGENKSKLWNDQLLEAINRDTAMVVLSSIHWTDGTCFDLEAIGKRCLETNTAFIVDGTQSVGAMPINLQNVHLDALVCAAYKWLCGPYSSALAYYGERFHRGEPLEISYLNKEGAVHFHKLIEYTDVYEKGAARFNMGEFSQFIHLPMLAASLDVVQSCDPQNIQQWGYQLTSSMVNNLKERGCIIGDAAGRGAHILGIGLPEGNNIEAIIQELKQHHFFVSRRGNSLRLSIHLYNTKEEVEALEKIIISQLL